MYERLKRRIADTVCEEWERTEKQWRRKYGR
jgi:hypothetical protein